MQLVLKHQDNLYQKGFLTDNFKSKHLKTLRKDTVEEIRKSFKKSNVKVIDAFINFDKAFDDIKSLSDTGELTDGIFLKKLKEACASVSKEDLRAIYLSSVAICKMDGVIQVEEQELLEHLNDTFGLDENVADLTSSVASERNYRKVMFGVVVVSLIALAVSAFLGYQSINAYIHPKINKVVDVPQYKFGTVKFSRYIVAGNSIKNSHFQKASIFFARGEANLLIDFKPLKLECKNRTINEWWNRTKTQLITHKKLPPSPIHCVAVYDIVSKSNSNAHVDGIPMLVEVQLDAENGWKKVAEVTPQAVDTSNLHSLPKMLGIVGAAGGAAFAYKYSQPASSSGGGVLSYLPKFLPFMPSLEGGSGFNMLMRAGATAAGGAAAGGAAYLLTRETLTMLDGLHLQQGITDRDEEKIKESSRSLIAAELAADDEMNNWYKKAFEESVKQLYAKIGVDIQSVVIK